MHRCAVVWNIKSQTQRVVQLTPSKDWGGTGLLGVTIRLDDYAGADERLIRALSVEHNSPAAIAGLEQGTDYLLGTTTVSFDDDASLAAVLRQNADRVIELYVYNTESDVVRVVTLMPTLSWGGGGLLGAEVGTGYLHRLPHGCRGTLGSSVERKVRTGASARPRQPQEHEQPEPQPQLQRRGGREGDLGQTANAPAEATSNGEEGGGGAATAAVPGTAPADALAHGMAMVDLTAPDPQGAAEVHLAPQLELEADPDDPVGHHRAAITVAGLHAAAAQQQHEKQRAKAEAAAEAEAAAIHAQGGTSDQQGEPTQEQQETAAPVTESVAPPPPPPPPPPPTAPPAPLAGFVPPPPPPQMTALPPPPPQFGATLQASPYMPNQPSQKQPDAGEGAAFPPPPPPPPAGAVGSFGGLPPPPIAEVGGDADVDLR